MIYIKLSLKSKFLELENKLSDSRIDIGSTYEDYLNNLWVLLSDEQVEFYKNNPTASVKEVWDMELTPAPEITLDEVKRNKIDAIKIYDSSTDVNAFTVNGIMEAWLTPEERSNYKSSIDAAKLVGLESLSFYINDVLLTTTPTQAELMLATIQLYADQCFIVTKQHITAVNALETIEEVENYDYTAGYPLKLNFEL